MNEIEGGGRLLDADDRHEIYEEEVAKRRKPQAEKMEEQRPTERGFIDEEREFDDS